MSDKNNGWEQPEVKYPETEFDDSFAEYFSEEEEIIGSDEGKKHKKKGPDILAVSDETDPGFVITEVVALDTGSEIVSIKEEEPSERTEEDEHGEEKETAEEEKADAHAENSVDENENPDEEEVVIDLVPEEKKEKKVLFANAKRKINRKRKHKYVATVGAALIGLATVGAIALCVMLVNFGIGILDNTARKEAFEWKVYPLLMFDPATFEEPNQLDEVFVLKTALWSTLFENRTKYAYDEKGMLLVPASDLDVAAKSLYGESVVLNHQTFSEGYEFFYIFDEETNTYSVPVSGQTASYVPKVVDIKKDGDIYTLIVGYVAPTTLWNVSEDGSSESVPDKYLYYDLQKTGRNSYVIKSVRTIPEEELPEDLEVSEMQSINSTQYFDYDEIYQEYLGEQMNGEEERTAEAAENTEETSEETSSAESEESSSDAE